jgi:hypothetical protein
MALRKPEASTEDNTTTTATAAAGAYEGMEQETTLHDETAAIDAPVVAPEVVASASRAIQTASARVMTSPLNKITTVIEGLRNVISGADLESMGIGVFPRITVGLDGFSFDKTNDLGNIIRIEVLSWNYVWLVTTGEQNDTEANKLIRTSYDGVNLKGGEGLISDYVAKLRADEYDKAGSKQYVEIYANLLWSEERGEVTEDLQKIHQISVSPQSVGKWGAFNLETKMRKMKGILDSHVLTLTGKKKSLGANKFGVIEFSVK